VQVASPAATLSDVPAPRRRTWVIRVIIAVVVLAAMLVAGRRFYDELYRLRAAPPPLVAAITVLWLASRYPAADVMRVSLAALGHHIGRYEAFMLQMVQSYGNVLVPRAGIGMPALYMKLRHDTPFADLGAVQILPMTLMQVFTIGAAGLACQAAMLAPGGAEPDRAMAMVFTGVAVACVVPLMVPVPAGGFGRGRLGAFVSRLAGAWQKLGRSRGVLGRVVLTHTLMLLVRALRVFVCFRAVGESVPYSGALAASLLADLAFVFAITPSGLGFREAALVYSARVMGTSGDVALAAAVLDRLVGTAVNVVVGQIGVWQFIRPALRARPAPPAAASGAPGLSAPVTRPVAPPPAR
jgi:uncharacterized membrane protein YbhN (UPF0104 family)